MASVSRPERKLDSVTPNAAAFDAAFSKKKS
jgi:hypothetical protein